MIADVIVDLQYGDCGKGKITHALCARGGYVYVIRYNGGCNAGHTIYHNKQKFITHHIPAGVFFGIKSIIGSGCVVSPKQFFKEIKEIQKQAKAAINDKQAQINDATQPLIENQGSLKKLKELLGKLEGKIEAATDK